MELCSFWIINPADGQDGRPEPIKLVFFEDGSIELISISEDPEYRGAYKLPAGSYYYSGETLKVPEEKLDKIITLISAGGDERDFKLKLYELGLINDQEWMMFYGNPRAWKTLRMVAVNFGEDSDGQD